MKIILVGYGEIAASLLLGILETKHEIAGILTWEKAKKNKIFLFLKNLFWPDQLTTLIKAHNIKEIKANSVNSQQFLKEALKLHPDVIIIGSWGEILKKKTIILPRIACINCHPSLLPKHRGSNPYISTIINGETKTGVTFHLIDEKIDSGPILLQREVEISNDDTGGSLRKKCAYETKTLVKELLEGLENAKFLPQKQDEGKATYYPRITPKEARIKWKNPAQIIHNQIRALQPWNACYTGYKNQFLMINSSKIIDLKNPVYEHGKILYKKGRTLIVSTGDPYKGIQIDKTRVYGFLSHIWSGYYINKNIRAGDYLGKN